MFEKDWFGFEQALTGWKERGYSSVLRALAWIFLQARSIKESIFGEVCGCPTFVGVEDAVGK
jgi:hypothetical protein